MEPLIAIGRKVDRALTAVDISLQACIFLAIFIAAIIYIVPVLEALVYVGALVTLAGGLILCIFLVLQHAWKRLRTR